MEKNFLGTRWSVMFFCTVLIAGSRDFVGPVQGQLNRQCPKAFFNFGTSITDTGNLLNALPFSPDVIKFADPENPPYGNAFFRRPAKRYSDGRLIPDFISLAFDVPPLDTYNAPTVFNFKHGVNFAIDPVGVLSDTTGTPFYLSLQIKQFIRFKSSALTAQSQSVTRRKRECSGSFHTRFKALIDIETPSGSLGADTGTQNVVECIPSISSLPPQTSFRDALYTLEFGSNDIRSAVQRDTGSATIIDDIIPTVVTSIVNSVVLMYQNEARNFLIYNVYPQGCSPQLLTLSLEEALPKDDLGCIAEINQLNEAYNRELFLKIQNLRESLPDANIMLFDFYNATFEILRYPSRYGFDSSSTLKACCGASGVGYYNYNPNITCGIHGSSSCENPDRSIFWDGIHFTESFYRTLSNFILKGQYTSPSIDYSEICNLDFTNFASSATYEQVYGDLCSVWYS